MCSQRYSNGVQHNYIMNGSVKGLASKGIPSVLTPHAQPWLEEKSSQFVGSFVGSDTPLPGSFSRSAPRCTPSPCPVFCKGQKG